VGRALRILVSVAVLGGSVLATLPAASAAETAQHGGGASAKAPLATLEVGNPSVAVKPAGTSAFAGGDIKAVGTNPDTRV
jgi:hypothetical protein